MQPSEEIILSLKNRFFQHLKNNTRDLSVSEKLWSEIVVNYSSTARHYHNLSHLQNIFSILDTQEDLLESKDSVYFATWYHDIIYNPVSKTNEEKSAEFAEQRMQESGMPEQLIKKTLQLILLTKSHNPENVIEFDQQLFLDADLAILGASENIYKEYSQAVRKEYSIYPDIIYNKGRTDTLKTFMNKPFIFSTEEMKEKLESKARQNIQWEIKQLAL